MGLIESLAVRSRFNRALAPKAIRDMLAGTDMPAKPEILEVGCGPGFALLEAAELLDAKRVVGIDVDPKMVSTARREAEARGIECAVFVLGAAEALPFESSTYDIVIGFEVLHHFDDWKCSMREIGRVLKPGGLFISRDIITTARATLITRVLHGIPRDLTWDNLCAVACRAGLVPHTAHRFFFHEETIFAKGKCA